MFAAETQQRLQDVEAELSKAAPAAQAQDDILQSLQDKYMKTGVLSVMRVYAWEHLCNVSVMCV